MRRPCSFALDLVLFTVRGGKEENEVIYTVPILGKKERNQLLMEKQTFF